MGTSVTFKLTGHKEMLRALEHLDERVQKKVVRRAVTAAARPIAAQARRNTPKRFGILARSIDVKTITRRGGTISSLIGPRSDIQARIVDPRTGREDVVRPSRYAHLVEFGTKAHAVGKGSRLWVGKGKKRKLGKQAGPTHRGTQGSRFLTRAVESQHGTASAILQNKLREGIMQAASEVGR